MIERGRESDVGREREGGEKERVGGKERGRDVVTASTKGRGEYRL